MAPEDDSNVISFLSPSLLLPIATPALTLEILDDSALLSLMKLRRALAETRSLQKDISERALFGGEGEIRARAVGHTLFEGERLWTSEEVTQSIADIEGMLPSNIRTVKSMRDIAKEEYAHRITCPARHIGSAAEVILCSDAKTSIEMIVRGVLEALEQAKGPIAIPLDPAILTHSCVQKMFRYHALASHMNAHIHDPKECAEEKAERDGMC